MATLRFPLDMFDRKAAAPPDWPDFPDLRRTVEWFRSLMTIEDWHLRRDQAASRLFLAAQGNRPELGESGRFFDHRDAFAWYLFLAEAYLDHPMNCEYVFGSRVLPIFDAIGRHVDDLKKMAGVEARVREMVTSKRSQPNGALFELLIAAAYLREGYQVGMVPELPGRQRTHDLDVEQDGVSWAVECKRMEASEYGEHERIRMRQLWIPYAEGFARDSLSVHCDVTFFVPLESVPDEYFSNIVDHWAGASTPYMWSDATSNGWIKLLDLGPLTAVLADDCVLSPSTRLLELLTGEYRPAANYVTSLKARPWDHPRYISECSLATVLHWESASEEATLKKARDGLALISRAVEQLPAGRQCAIHVGFEAVNGDAVEMARLQRFKDAMSSFDAKAVQLEFVYAHCLVPESPPNKAWRFRETGTWHRVVGHAKRPLQSPLLVLHSGEPDLEGGHWDYRGMWDDE